MGLAYLLDLVLVPPSPLTEAQLFPGRPPLDEISEPNPGNYAVQELAERLNLALLFASELLEPRLSTESVRGIHWDRNQAVLRTSLLDQHTAETTSR